VRVAFVFYALCPLLTPHEAHTRARGALCMRACQHSSACMDRAGMSVCCVLEREVGEAMALIVRPGVSQAYTLLPSRIETSNQQALSLNHLSAEEKGGGGGYLAIEQCFYHSRVDTCTCSCGQCPHPFARACTQKYARVQHARTRTRTHTHAHARARTHAHTHTHTHQRSCLSKSPVLGTG
jgi:hypothetical protein